MLIEQGPHDRELRDLGNKQHQHLFDAILVACERVLARGGLRANLVHLAPRHAGCAPIPDARLEALRRFSEQVVEHRGRVQGDALAAFVGAGYQPA